MQRSSLGSERPSVLPAFLSAPRISAKVWVAAAVGIGCAVCAYAGVYPRFDNGDLRVLVALTSGPFGAAAAAYALSAKTWGRAFRRALGGAAMLGVASTVLPGMCLASANPSALGFVMLFGLFFGVPTGAMYGLPIAILVALVHKRVRDGSQEGNDRSSRLAGVWLALGAAFAGVVTWQLDVLRNVSPLDEASLASYRPLFAASFAFVVGLAIATRATFRLRRRTRWIERVSGGGERWFRVRPIGMRDELEALPRLGPDANLVVEWCGAGEGTMAYRAPATGTAVALVRARDERVRVSASG